MALTSNQQVAINYVRAIKKLLPAESIEYAIRENRNQDEGARCFLNHYVDATGLLCAEVSKMFKNISLESADESDAFYVANQYARRCEFDEHAIGRERLFDIDTVTHSERKAFLNQCLCMAEGAENTSLVAFLQHELSHLGR